MPHRGMAVAVNFRIGTRPPYLAKRIMFKWFNYRGGRHRMNWEKYTKMLLYEGYPEKWSLQSMF